MPFEYTGILLGLFAVTFYLQKKYQIKLFENQKQALIFFGTIFLLSSIWDNLAVLRGHWLFPGKGILGVFIGQLPIEEYLFFLITPYFAITLYRLISKKF